MRSSPSFWPVAAQRGQRIQGARYLVWALFFSVLWNLLELRVAPRSRNPQRLDYALVLGFLSIALVTLPYESLRMHAVLSQRARTMKAFEAQHLDLLHDKQGIASDIGYIGYFSQARMCDLSGIGKTDGRPPE